MSNFLSLKTISIPSGQSMLVQLGAMEAYSDKKITMNTGTHTSWYSAASRKIFGGENFFLNKFSASSKEAGWIALEEATPGQVAEHTLQPNDLLIIKKGSFIACDSNVYLAPSITGLHGYLSKIGFVILQAQTNDNKPGRIFLNSGNGVIKKLELTNEDEPVIVDNNNIIAYTGGLSLSTTAPGGPLSWRYGEEGLVTRFTGKGTVYIGSPKATSEESIRRAEQAAIRAEKAKEDIEIITKKFFERK